MRAGFTLIELIVVLALVAFIATLTIKCVLFSTTTSARIELERLYALAFYLQQRAYVEQKQQTLTINPKSNSYTGGSRSYTLAHPLIFGTLAGTKGPPSEPEKPITHPITFKNNTIVFYPGGTISAGTMYLTDTSKSCLYALSCAISQVSHIRRYKYHKRWIMLE
jgi:prepilin-type N-terminal cleavage/methylation domain-containing protein